MTAPYMTASYMAAPDGHFADFMQVKTGGHFVDFGQFKINGHFS